MHNDLLQQIEAIETAQLGKGDETYQNFLHERLLASMNDYLQQIEPSDT